MGVPPVFADLDRVGSAGDPLLDRALRGAEATLLAAKARGHQSGIARERYVSIAPIGSSMIAPSARAKDALHGRTDQ